MYASPAIIAPPNIAGILAIFSASFGNTRANEYERTAGTLCIALAPKGHGLPLHFEGDIIDWLLVFVRRRRPLREVALVTSVRRATARPRRGPTLLARSRTLITGEALAFGR